MGKDKHAERDSDQKCKLESIRMATTSFRLKLSICGAFFESPQLLISSVLGFREKGRLNVGPRAGMKVPPRNL